jgi:hypothetical protein
VQRSPRRIVHSEIDVKSWTESLPSCGVVRPSHCPACEAASRPPGRPLVVVGHGLRARSIEGPLAPGEAPVVTDVIGRRYACRASDAVIIVVPRGVARGHRYALGAIAAALAWWGYDRVQAAQVRERTSTAKTVGAASATRWASLARWTRCALSLFGIEPPTVGTLRERAARVATFVASHAPISRGAVVLDAFYGAAFCRPR